MVNKHPKEIAFAFDLDGTLVDTEKYKALSHGETIRYFGGEAPPDIYYQFTGNSFDFVFEKLTGYIPAPVSLTTYKKIFNDFYLKELEQDLRPEKGAIELLEEILSGGFKMALVTSSEKWMTNLIVDKINISKYFDVFVSGDDVKLNKPAPDPYILTIKLLHATKTFVIEDTLAGIRSAKDAGAIVFGVKNKYNKVADLAQAERVLADLNDFDLAGVLKKY